MRLSMTGEYAIRAMLDLASYSPGDVLKISDISKRQDIPETLLRKIISQLVKLGFVYSFRGSGGGISLARPPETVTLLDVIEATEGKVFLNKCLIGPEFCSRTPYCAVHSVWREVQDKMVDTLWGRSLTELAQDIH